ncbi:hypothetical protein D9V32_05575 [Mycetocola tolaasinivorans]|uniref:Uncharacterized protein n=1 Tax=Mycetocola tolaasinivorans TaxID=76635 RepID=A0A3L7A928_9MICO|nr:peptidoglycan DD-metalloendopeptidase family protein [Mycetocola tolaasinivorans]RLP76340.1 hypothetical protein D9V32_05575 [Mycetocola tolaasinivorans]
MAELRLTKVTPTQRYGNRILNGKPDFHRGVDFAFGRGVPVSVMGDGVIIESGFHRVYGHYVKAEHEPGVCTSYHALDAAGLPVGTRVKMGDTIGVAGSSALGSTGPHSHQGLWLHGETRDLLAYLKPGVIVTVGAPAVRPPAGSTTVPARAVQIALVARGYNVVVDGVYGPQTAAVVRLFQRTLGLVVDGVVGPQTWAKLRVVEDRLRGRQTIRAVQAGLGTKVDENPGPVTDALALKKYGFALSKATPAQILDLQRRANAGTL